MASSFGPFRELSLRRFLKEESHPLFLMAFVGSVIKSENMNPVF